MFNTRYLSVLLILALAVLALPGHAQDDGDPFPAPPGRIVAGDELGLFTILADGSGQEYLIEDGEATCWLRDGAWSPDGTRLLYTRICGGGAPNNWRPKPDEGPRTAQVFVYEFESNSSSEVVANNGNYQDYAGNWHPDGQQFVIYSNEQDDTYNLYLINFLSGEKTQLTAFADNVGHVSWDPTGRFLLYNRYVTQPDGLRWEVHALDTQGTIPASDDMTVAQGFTPHWSPDGQWITYADEEDIYVMPSDCILDKTQCTPQVDAINVTQSPGIKEREPMFSPDQTQLVYLRDTNDNPNIQLWDIFRQDLRTGLLQQLTNTPSVSERNSSWEPVDTEVQAVADNLPVIGSVNATSSVNMRSTPVIGDNIVAVLNSGKVVFVQGIAQNPDRDWYRVTLSEDGTSGWIATSLITIEIGDAADIPDITDEQ
jgi:Tol biopolymer transport system component